MSHITVLILDAANGRTQREGTDFLQEFRNSSCILQKLMRYLGLVGVPPSLYTHSFTQATFTTAALTLPRSSCNWYAEWTTIVVCRGGWRCRTPQNTRWGLTSNTDITLGTQPAVHSGAVCRKHCKHSLYPKWHSWHFGQQLTGSPDAYFQHFLVDCFLGCGRDWW